MDSDDYKQGVIDALGNAIVSFTNSYQDVGPDAEICLDDVIERLQRLQKSVPEAAQSTLTRLRSERDAAVAIVRECEWSSYDGFSSVCPSCGNYENRGHAHHCRIGKLLADHPDTSAGQEADPQ